MMPDYEKLGAFYLGREKQSQQILLYDSKDLVTHAVCVGMTGSGKSGLCIALLEEAAIDGIPAIVIDPKGDLSNLLLTFPQLRPSDFEPWVNPDEARNKGLSAAEFAAQQAKLWKDGLASWDQDGSRIARFQDSAEFTVYTPGSEAGVPVAVTSSFQAPGEVTMDDREAARDQVSATVTSLLGLAGVNADPIQSREHVLLSALFDRRWKEGADFDLPALIAEIQTPPIDKVGVMDLETFYPAKERFQLAMSLNNLLASPAFAAWMHGEPLDIDRMLFTSAGKPRVSIFSIAHLPDAERMFFVSLLLNQIVAWMRKQSGTTSLRAVLYMDEIFGYFPPVANPPSKKPLLTLLKQSRAFGLGCILATQNPVDLDYKGLANTGTWFIGRLQTERDKARVLEGLEGASASSGVKFDKQQMEQTLAGLGNRVFLMNNVHEDKPVLFETRWCLSYLRGPLSRPQIRQLMEGRVPVSPATAETSVQPEVPKVNDGGSRPVLPPDIPQYFLPLRTAGPATYRPVLLGAAEIHFVDSKSGVDELRKLTVMTPIADGAAGVDWDASVSCEEDLEDLEKEPDTPAIFAALPSAAANAKNFARWQKEFSAWLFRSQSMTLFRSPAYKQLSKPGESERDFTIRLNQLHREQRDAAVEKLRAKYAPKIATLEERKRRALQTVAQQQQQASTQKFQSVIDVGTSILGAFLGRRGSVAGKVSGAARSVGRVSREAEDVKRAQETADAVDRQLEELNARFQEDLSKIGDAAGNDTVETVLVRPKKANIRVKLVALAWKPENHQ